MLLTSSVIPCLLSCIISDAFALKHIPPLKPRDVRTGTGAVEYDPTIPNANIAPIRLNAKGWTASATSSKTGNGAFNALDGTGATWWQSNSGLPQTVTIDMKSSQSVTGFTYLPRQDGSNAGNVAQHRIETSLDGNTWNLKGSGTYRNNQARKTTLFSSSVARYVRLVAQTEPNGNGYAAVAEIYILSAPEPFLPRDGWRVSADSQNPYPNERPAIAAIDGATTTSWVTQYDGATPSFPHALTIDQGSAVAVAGLAYLADPVSPNGRIGQFNVQSSSDGNNWNTVASGSWPDSADPKYTQFAPVTARYFRLTCLSEAGGRGPWCNAAEVNLLDGRRAFADFTATADSEEATVADQDGRAVNALDGNTDTFWVTAWNGNQPGYPHRFTIDMQNTFNIQGLNYTPRQDMPNGNIGQHNIEVSTDNQAWTRVATGSWIDNQDVKVSNWVGISARYFRLNALSEAGGRGPWASAAEIKPIISSSFISPPPLQGRWSSVIDFPLVPVSAALIPKTGKVLTWSGYAPDAYGQPGKTYTATFDPATGLVSQEVVTSTNHAMFCPGISLATYGAIIVSGGENAEPVSSYINGAWSKAADMQTPRGYNSQVTLSNGRIFTIGGSWSGGLGGKNGEVYDPGPNTWTKLPGCTVDQLLTNDKQGIYRQDNHGWLFARGDGSIFQAGPSSAMNWYTTSSASGDRTSAGNRASDPDSMNGNAVMYDAVAGKILTVGGSPSYDGSVPTSNAHIVTVGNTPGSTASVQRIANMNYPRAFHNSVILPTGQVVIIGGLSYARVFTDDTAVMYPELFDPKTLTFTKLAPMSVARAYHSIALLLPDGTVFAGGGGLCGKGCAVNHFDAQILKPPYLFDGAGNLAPRPQIISSSPTTDVKIGARFSVTTNGPVTSFSLVRFSSVTHSINTDQRRVPLTPISTNGNTYTLQTPNEPGIVVPGSWMLFAVNGKGVPSEGRIMYFF